MRRDAGMELVRAEPQTFDAEEEPSELDEQKHGRSAAALLALGNVKRRENAQLLGSGLVTYAVGCSAAPNGPALH